MHTLNILLLRKKQTTIDFLLSDRPQKHGTPAHDLDLLA